MICLPPTGSLPTGEGGGRGLCCPYPSAHRCETQECKQGFPFYRVGTLEISAAVDRTHDAEDENQGRGEKEQFKTKGFLGQEPAEGIRAAYDRQEYEGGKAPRYCGEVDARKEVHHLYLEIEQHREDEDAGEESQHTIHPHGAFLYLAIVEQFGGKHTVCHLPYYLKREYDRGVEHEFLIAQPLTYLVSALRNGVGP